MRLIPYLLTVFFILSPVSEAHARLLVSVTVPAQAWLVKQITGSHADILTMIPAGHVAETAQPGPRKLARSQQADLHFIVGHPALYFETRYIRPYQQSGNTAVWISMYDAATGLQTAESLEKSDPHLWTSVAIMSAAGKMLADSLIQLDAENAGSYRENWQKLDLRLQEIDAQIRGKARQAQPRELLVYHPAWGHFCRDFGLRQIAIENEGKPPGPGELSRIINAVAAAGLPFIISSPGADQRLAGIIAAQLQIKVLTVDPMDPDWMHMMESMENAVAKLEKSL